MTAKQTSPLDVLIVDDEPLARRRIESLCARIDGVGRIGAASSGREALQIAAREAPALLLLDIDMPDISGMEVAARCGTLDHPPAIIFTTAHSQYAVEAFRCNAADYLLKPVKESELREALGRVRELRSMADRPESADEGQYMWVQDRHGAIRICCADIEWIEADRDYMRLRLADRQYLVHESMQSLQKRLPAEMFMRVHRSAMVRRDLVRQLRRAGRRYFLVLADGREMNVGPSYRALVEQSFERLVGSAET